MEINGKAIIYGVLILITLFILLFSFGTLSLNPDKAMGDLDYENTNVPEKCRPPNGQSISAWKEHLGHHAETQDCLKYF